MRLKTWTPIFVIIAIILSIVGYIRDDYLFYIRAGIFLVASGVAWWLDESGYVDKFNKRISKWVKKGKNFKRK